MRMCSLRGQIPAQEGRTPYKPLGQNDHSGHIQPHVRSQSPVTQGLRGRGLKPLQSGKLGWGSVNQARCGKGEGGFRDAAGGRFVSPSPQ